MFELPMTPSCRWFNCQRFRGKSTEGSTFRDLPLLGKLFQSKTETGQKRGHYCYYPFGFA